MADKKLYGIKELKKHNLIMPAQDLVDREYTVIPVAPCLDLALGGGLKSGSFVTISGKPKSGKSTASLQVIANAQKEEYGRREAFYFDVEHRLSRKELSGIEGLIIANSLDEFGLKVIQSNIHKKLSAEDVLNSCEQLIRSYPGCVIVLDSVSSLCCESELTSQITATGRNQGPRLFGNFLRKNKDDIPIYDCLFIHVNHLIANTSGYGPSMYEDGGNKKEYQNDTKIRITSFSKWEEDGEQIGQEVSWKVFWSALGPPGKTATTRIRYGIGYDRIEDIISLSIDTSLIKLGGSWFTFEYGGEEVKLQGKHKMAEFLRGHPDYADELYKKIKELVL